MTLVARTYSRAAFIFSCSWRSSSVSLAGLTLGVAFGSKMKDILTTSSVYGVVSWGSGWEVWVKLGVSPDVTTQGDICMIITIEAGVAESIHISLRHPQFLLLRVEPPGPLKVALSWMFYAGRQGLKLLRKPIDSHSKASWRCKLMAMRMLWKGSTVSPRE